MYIRGTACLLQPSACRWLLVYLPTYEGYEFSCLLAYILGSNTRQWIIMEYYWTPQAAHRTPSMIHIQIDLLYLVRAEPGFQAPQKFNNMHIAIRQRASERPNVGFLKHQLNSSIKPIYFYPSCLPRFTISIFRT